MPNTQIPDIEQDDWAKRMVDLYPADWTGDEAKVKAGVMYSFFTSWGNQLAVISDQEVYAWKTARLTTAIDTGLDIAAGDYFSPDMIERVPGEGDDSFRARVLAELFLPAATKPAIKFLLGRLVGSAPRLMEPWNPHDTAVWDTQSYWDIDTEDNSARWGDPGLRFQGFIDTPMPSFAGQGDNPVWMWDKGFAWDTPGSCFLQVEPTWFINQARLDALITRKKVFGTTIWRKYRSQPFQKHTVGGTVYFSPGQTNYPVTINPAMAGLFSVVAFTNWNAAIDAVITDNDAFTLVANTPAPAGGFVDWVASPITVPGTGNTSVPQGTTTVTIGVPVGMVGYRMIASPSWTTNTYFTEVTDAHCVLQFSVAAPENARLNYYFVKPPQSGLTDIWAAGDLSITIPIATRFPFQAGALPSWSTQVTITKSVNGLLVNFNTPAPAGAQLLWAYHES